MAKVPYHPTYDKDLYWDLRAVVSRTNDYVVAYLRRYSLRESTDAFNYRKQITPNDAQPRIALKKLCDSIRGRMVGIRRKVDLNNVMVALDGENKGVDAFGSSMTGLMSDSVVYEVALMGRVGLFVNRDEAPSDVKAEASANDPYIQVYPTETIVNWVYGSDGLFNDLLLQISEDVITDGFVTGTEKKFRRFTRVNGKVTVTTYDKDFENGEERVWDVPMIPFYLIDFESQVERVLEMQKALNNLASSDYTFLIKSNFPLYTEQVDQAVKAQIQHNAIIAAQTAEDTGSVESAVTSHSKKVNTDVDAGTFQGREYGKDLDRPGWVTPPTAHLTASADRQELLKSDIDKALDVDSLNVREVKTSADSKQIDRETLIGGIYNLFLQLQRAETQILKMWLMYMDSASSVLIEYPDAFDLRSQEERLKAADKKLTSRDSVPSITAKRSLTLAAVGDLLPHATEEAMQKIAAELEKAEMFATPTTLEMLVTEGAIPSELTMDALALDVKYAGEAKKEHAEKMAVIAAAQSAGSNSGQAETDADKEQRAKPTNLGMNDG